MRYFWLFLIFLSAPGFAQTCSIPPSGEAFCAARAGLSGGNAGDFVFAGRVNGLVRCITVDFINYFDQKGGLQFWFDSGVVFDRSDFVPQRKFTVYVDSVNTWTNVIFYVHRNTCNASPTFMTSRFLSRSVKGRIDVPSDFQDQPASRFRNSP